MGCKWVILNFNPGPSPGLEAKRQDSAWNVARAQEAVEQEQAWDPEPGPAVLEQDVAGFNT